METATQKADTLIGALNWIRKFRDKTFVVQLGDTVLENEQSLQAALTDIHFMESVGIRTVVVHGGCGRLEKGFSNDSATKMLANELNEDLAGRFERLGGRAMTLNFESTPVLLGEVAEHSPDGISFGQVVEVERLVIDNLCYAGQVPFIPPMCLTEDDQKLVVVSEVAAAIVADQLNAEKLIIVGNGIVQWTGNESHSANTVALSELRSLVEAGDEKCDVLNHCLKVSENRTTEVHFVNGTESHSLLLEIFTHEGCGTLLVGDS